MVFVARMMLLGCMALGSAYAAGQGVASSTALPQSQGQEKVAAIQQEQSVGVKSKTVHKKVNKPIGAEKVEPKATGKQDNATETPFESSDQSVQLRGVRG